MTTDTQPKPATLLEFAMQYAAPDWTSLNTWQMDERVAVFAQASGQGLPGIVAALRFIEWQQREPLQLGTSLYEDASREFAVRLRLAAEMKLLQIQMRQPDIDAQQLTAAALWDKVIARALDESVSPVSET